MAVNCLGYTSGYTEATGAATGGPRIEKLDLRSRLADREACLAWSSWGCSSMARAPVAKFVLNSSCWIPEGSFQQCFFTACPVGFGSNFGSNGHQMFFGELTETKTDYFAGKLYLGTSSAFLVIQIILPPSKSRQERTHACSMQYA